jgi:hypothetical protein
MNIDMTFDYDKLLAQAQDEYAKVLASGDALRVASTIHRPDEGDKAEKFKQAVASWRAWRKKNVEKRGVRLALDTANRDIPVGIVAVISGHG